MDWCCLKDVRSVGERMRRMNKRLLKDYQQRNEGIRFSLKAERRKIDRGLTDNDATVESFYQAKLFNRLFEERSLFILTKHSYQLL